MVCGSVGYGGMEEIRNLYSVIQNKGFEIVDHLLHQRMNYSAIEDFRDKKDLSDKIVRHDLEYVEESDIVVVLINRPSYGTGIEIFVAKSIGKKVILLAKDPVPTPWPINFSDYIVNSEEDLLELLSKLNNSEYKT